MQNDCFSLLNVQICDAFVATDHLKELSQIVLPHFRMLKNNDEVCLLQTK